MPLLQRRFNSTTIEVGTWIGNWAVWKDKDPCSRPELDACLTWENSFHKKMDNIFDYIFNMTVKKREGKYTFTFIQTVP